MKQKFTLLLSAMMAAGVCNASSMEAPQACSTLYSPYHEMTVSMQGGQPLDLVSISKSTGIKSYTLAFIIDSGNCTPSWEGQYSVASGWASALTNNMRAAGINYAISFGGAAGNDISKNCNASQLLNAYNQILNTYQPNRLDFDIENGTANVANIMTALKGFQAAHPSTQLSFTLAVMPTGLDSSGKSVVQQAVKAGLNFIVNVMTMDYSSSMTGDMGQYAISALNSTYTFLASQYPSKTPAQIWAMIGATPMIGVNDIRGENFTLANATTLANFANQNGMGLLTMWALTRDKPCSGTTATATCSGGNLQTANYQYSAQLNQCGSGPTPPTPTTCLAPANITYSVSSNKKAITFNWSAPTGGSAVTSYQVNDYQHKKMWSGAQKTFTDSSLPGTPDTFEYYFVSNCAGSSSVEKEVAVKIK